MNCDKYKDQIILSKVFQRTLDKKLPNNQLRCIAYHLCLSTGRIGMAHVECNAIFQKRVQRDLRKKSF